MKKTFTIEIDVEKVAEKAIKYSQGNNCSIHYWIGEALSEQYAVCDDIYDYIGKAIDKITDIVVKRTGKEE